MIVLDTHALVWWLADPAKLSAAARRAVLASAAEKEVAASTASVLEIATLVRRQRLILSVPFEEWLSDVRQLSELQLLPISVEIAARAGSFGSEVHGDPIDRLIVATALEFKSPLVTADSNIRSLPAVRTIW